MECNIGRETSAANVALGSVLLEADDEFADL